MEEQWPVKVYVGQALTDVHEAAIDAVRDLTGVEHPVLTHACLRCGSCDHGRPIIVGAGRMHVSLARPTTPGPAVFALCMEANVGIDVERTGAADFDGFPRVALHPAEACDTPEAGTRLWVRKEALLKAHGTGLITDPRTVRLADDGRVIEGPSGTIVDVTLGEGWQCAVAVTPPAKIQIEHVVS